MILDTDSTKPIYIQIAEWLETEILREKFKQDEKVYSQYQLAEMFNINPATAAKGLNLLAEENILYDKRGIGKFVSKHAKDFIKDKRKNEVLSGLIENIVQEAMNLRILEDELLEMVKAASQKLKGEEK